MKRVYYIRVQLAKASRRIKPSVGSAIVCEGIIRSWDMNRSTFLYRYEMRIIK